MSSRFAPPGWNELVPMNESTLPKPAFTAQAVLVRGHDVIVGSAPAGVLERPVFPFEIPERRGWRPCKGCSRSAVRRWCIAGIE